MRTPRRGQALVEFALLMLTFIVFAIVAIKFYPLASARGDVVELAESLSRRVSQYTPPAYDSELPEGTGYQWLCGEVDELARALAGPEGLQMISASTAASSPGCTTDKTKKATSGDIVVYLQPFGEAEDEIFRTWRPTATSTVADMPTIELCVAYTYAYGDIELPFLGGGGKFVLGTLDLRHCTKGFVNVLRSR